MTSHGHYSVGQGNLVNGTMTPQPPQQQYQQQQTQQQMQFSPINTLPSTQSIGSSKFGPPAPLSSTAPAVIPHGMPPKAQIPINNLPAHLRPPTLNGPLSSAPQTVLTNGAGASANSSRTASPALTTLPGMLQPQPARPPLIAGGVVNPSGNVPTHGGFQGTPVPNHLSGSMQNMNLNRSNGPTGGTPLNPLAALQHQTQSKPIVPNNMPPSAGQAPRMPPANQSLGAIGAPYNNQSLTHPNGALPVSQPTTISGSIASRPPPSHVPTSMASSTPPTPMSQQVGVAPQPIAQQRPPIAPSNVTYPTPVSMAPSITLFGDTSALHQNQLNNNSQQQQQQPMPDPLPKQLNPAQRRPMYPTANILPAAPSLQPQQQQPQQQQSQQPYMQAYHQSTQPPTPLAGTFNGQSNAAPLQYQPLAYAQPPQQPQQPLQQQYPQQFPGTPQQPNQPLNITQQGFSRLWGQDTIDLMQNRHILTRATLQPPKVVLHNQFHESINCNPSIMRCTVAKIPESNSLLQKSRLPLGILIHPFRDINSLPVIQCPNIVRCRLCRTYINPFVYFVDSKLWKCNLCYRVNELPEDFQFDPATKTYGDVTRRPEVRSSTIEFIAPSEYMLRPPQPAIYLFLFDVSIIAQQSGYLESACAVLSEHLTDMPGDARTQVGFVAYNSQVHFYSMADGYNQPHEMTLLDIDDPFLPRPDSLLVNLKECKELVKDLLVQLPKRFADTHDPGSALGAALQVAYKLMQASGGRVTVFQTCLPNKGPGSLEPREDPNNRSAKDVAHLNPATDFYKRFALECSGFQIAVDLFLLNQQYSDLATIAGTSKHSGGCIHHFPLYQRTKPQHVDSFKQCFKRYLVRKIGFEAVMRIRCTRGLQVHTFHGNFFVRSTDLLSLPNVNPDAGYGMQISYEENLSDVKTVCFQAALLYTNSEGERRIRVHTLCLPVTASLPEVMHAADAEAIVGLLSKMAVDRSLTSNVTDAREAFINATVDVLNAFKIAQNLPAGQTGQLIAPRSLALLPLYILALLKHPAFRVGTSTRLDDRVFAMESMKTLPLDQLMKYLYPEFYQIDVLFYNAPNTNANAADDDDDDEELPDVPRLQLSAEFLDSRSIFLLDCGALIIIYVGLNVPVHILDAVLGIKSTAELQDYCYGLPNVNSAENAALRRFVMRLNDEKPFPPLVQIIRDTSTAKPQVMEKLVDDRSESSLSYYEFLQHIRTQVK